MSVMNEIYVLTTFNHWFILSSKSKEYRNIVYDDYDDYDDGDDDDNADDDDDDDGNITTNLLVLSLSLSEKEK